MHLSLLFLFIIGLGGCDASDRVFAWSDGGGSPLPGSPPAARRDPFIHGVFLGDVETTPERVAGALANFASAAGDRPTLVKSFHSLSADLSSSGWAGRVLRAVDAAGATNLVALDLNFPGGPSKDLLAAIDAGQADAAIARAARGIAGAGATVLVQPGWEMNGNWGYAWQGLENGANAGAAQAYVRVFRRVVDIFRREGATNVRWVFSPNTGNPVAPGSGPGHWNWYGHYYPGDQYVDYVGPHGFNGPSVWGGPWRSFSAMMDSREMDFLLSDIAGRYRKPILIAEFATEEPRTGGQSKADWIAHAYRDMLDRPEIAGAVWFNMNKESNWRIDTSSGALAAYRAALSGAAATTVLQFAAGSSAVASAGGAGSR